MQNATAYGRVKGAEEIVSIADACLGGLRGRSALLVGPQEERRPYIELLQQAGMKYLYQEDTPQQVSALLPHIQLLISVPATRPSKSPVTIVTNVTDVTLATGVPLLTAAAIARGCIGRRTPLLIFDLSESTASVEELAGLLPAVCLYTPEDLRRIFARFDKLAV